MGDKDGTGKWFIIFLIPTILSFIPALAMGVMAQSMKGAGAGATMMMGGMGTVMGIAGIIAFAVGIYVLYKIAETVSGHEKAISGNYEVVQHLDRKDSTVKWFIIGIIPIVNLYLLWKMSEMVSGHETVR